MTTTAIRPIRLGLVGYGVGGKYFHAPFIRAAEGVELVGVVARSAGKQEDVARDLPGVSVFPSLSAMIAEAGLDAVAITTPPQTRRDLVLEAIGAGLHVVADKPFGPSAGAAQLLVDAAARAGVVLNVFHNRRRDADFVTLRGVVASGALGEIRRFRSIMDQDSPDSLETGPTGGLLRDLGSHVVDQHLTLLGPVTAVHATLDITDRFGSPTDCAFWIWMQHASGATSTTSATKLNYSSTRELRVYGTEGIYAVQSADVQTDAVFAGVDPAADREGWGYDVPANWGTLATAAGRVRIPSAQGDYTGYYEDFARAVRGAGPEPVPGAEGVAVLAVLDAARLSAESGRLIRL